MDNFNLIYERGEEYRTALREGSHPSQANYLHDLTEADRVVAEDHFQSVYLEYLEGDPHEEPLVGLPWGKFQIESEIGDGGMGRVFRVRDNLGRTVALKVIKGDSLSDDDCCRYEDRLIEEARHASLVGDLDGFQSIYEADRIGPHAYYTQELVQQGQRMKDVVQRIWTTEPGHTPIWSKAEWERTNPFDVFRDLLEIVARAHTHGISHGDISPNNVMLTQDGQIRVIDFGLSWLHRIEIGATVSGIHSPDVTIAPDGTQATLRGTPGFVSPERYLGASPQSDVYSLGCLLYNLAYGRRPFAEEGVTELQIIEHARQKSVPWSSQAQCPELTASLQSVAQQASELDSTKRFVDAAAMLRAWDDALELDRKQQLAAALAPEPRRPLSYGNGQICAALGGLLGSFLALWLHYGNLAVIIDAWQGLFHWTGGRWIVPVYVVAPLVGGFLGGLVSIRLASPDTKTGLRARLLGWALIVGLGCTGGYLGTLGGLLFDDAVPFVRFLIVCLSLPGLLAFAAVFLATSVPSDWTLAPIGLAAIFGVVGGVVASIWPSDTVQTAVFIFIAAVPVLGALILHILTHYGWNDPWELVTASSKRGDSNLSEARSYLRVPTRSSSTRGDILFIVGLVAVITAAWGWYYQDHRRLGEPGLGYRDVVFMQGGGAAFTGDSSGRVGFANLYTGTFLPDVRRVPASLTHLAVSPDTQFLLAARGYRPGEPVHPTQSSDIQVSAIHTGRVWNVPVADNPVRAIAFSRDSTHFAISTGRSVEVWSCPDNNDGPRRVTTHSCANGVSGVDWIHQRLVVGTLNSTDAESLSAVVLA